MWLSQSSQRSLISFHGWRSMTLMCCKALNTLNNYWIKLFNRTKVLLMQIILPASSRQSAMSRPNVGRGYTYGRTHKASVTHSADGQHHLENLKWKWGKILYEVCELFHSLKLLIPALFHVGTQNIMHFLLSVPRGKLEREEKRSRLLSSERNHLRTSKLVFAPNIDQSVLC